MRRSNFEIVCTLTFAALILLAPESARAETLYKIYGPRGIVTFTTREPSPGSKFSVIAPRSTSFSMVYTARGMSLRAMESKYDPLILATANEHDVEPALVKAVIHAESSFNPLARSNKGAMGLMQLMPGTAERMGCDDAYHPEKNIAGGVKYLKMLMGRYDGNLRLALAAYNAGEGAVDKIQAVPPYSETVRYVQRVMLLLKAYRAKNAAQKSG